MNIFERLNVECDERSKAFRARLESKEIVHQPIGFSDSNWYVTLGNLRISYNLPSSIKDHILGTKLVNKMISRGDLTRLGASLVDWTMMGGAAAYQNAGDNLWIAKFVSGFSATAIQLTYRQQQRKKRNI